jgi:hypothetical protein
MEKLDLTVVEKLKSNTISDLCVKDIPQKTSGRILHYRRIQGWENYFLASAICSVGKSVGSDIKDLSAITTSRNPDLEGQGIEDFHFYSAITGDMFANLYSREKNSDCGITNYFFMPHIVKKAYAAFGYECIYISNEHIKKEFRAVMNAIKNSIDNGIPVLAWGMGNVILKDGSQCDPLPEASLIGGYDVNDLLYVNLYCGSERVATDDDGYTAITNGLNTTKGLFFVGRKIKKTDLKKVYQEAVNSIPSFLTLPPVGGYVFGRTAFELWADTLLDDSFFEEKSDDELNGVCWNLHLSPYCCLCTSEAYNFIKGACEKYPDLEFAKKVLPLYEQKKQCKDDIWALQGGFYPPMGKFREHQFRAEIANILRKMGKNCDDILSKFS